jgi:hypothetical protein
MRKRHWLKCLLGGWLSLVGGQILAQDSPYAPYAPGVPGGPVNPDAAAMLPPPYSANYGTNPMVYQRGPAMYPPDANAWPNVSPFYGPGVSQTAQQDGFWFNKILAGNRKYYLTTEALISYTGHPNSVIGAPGVNIVPPTIPGVIYPDNNQQFQETPAGTNAIDRETVSSTGGNGGGNNNNNNNGSGSSGDSPIFVTQDTSILSGNNGMMNAGGFRGTWGWWNPDQSGFQVSGFWQGQANASAYLGDPRGFDPTLYTNSTFLQTNLLQELHAYAGIPLAGADTDHNGLPGVVQPFDMGYRIQYQTQTMGANVDWYAAPLYERTAFMIRPLYGARYMQVSEQFQFNGADSGLGYTVNTASSAGNGANNGGATGTTTGSGNLTPATLEATTQLNVMYSALNSKVTSHLAGPEAGLRFDFGGDHLKVWTQSKFALLSNTSTRQISGYNIGDDYYAAVGSNPVMSRGTPNPNGVSPNNYPFAHSIDNTTVLSPLFEQSIFAKANVFQFIPVLKKSKILHNAEVQVGYTAIFVGNMYRPSNTVSWYAYNPTNPAFPNGPQIADTRSTLFLSNLSLGVNWDY